MIREGDIVRITGELDHYSHNHSGRVTKAYINKDIIYGGTVEVAILRTNTIDSYPYSTAWHHYNIDDVELELDPERINLITGLILET